MGLASSINNESKNATPPCLYYSKVCNLTFLISSCWKKPENVSRCRSLGWRRGQKLKKVFS